MKQFKKLIACILAATLLLGSSTIFLAAETGTITGNNNKLEGVVNRDVFSVVTPTNAVSDNAYDFTLDPENLIQITSGSKYATDGSIKFISYGSMYFQVSSNAYNTISQKATVENKSSVDVTVTLDAVVTPVSGTVVEFVSSSSFSSTDLEIYLAIEAEKNGVAVTGASISTVSGSTYTANISADLASYNAYKVDVSGGEYVYIIDETKTATADTYTFWLTGACNTNADWSVYKDNSYDVDLELVWTVDVKSADEPDADEPDADEPDADEPEQNGPQATTDINGGVYTADMSKTTGVTFNYTVANADVTITAIKGGQVGSASADFMQYASFDTANKTVTISGVWNGVAVGQQRDLVFTFSDGTTKTITVTMK